MIPTKNLLIGLFAALCFAALVYEVVQRMPRRMETPQLGELRAFPAWLWQRGFVYVFSGSDGWSLADETVARGYARAGNFVAGIDTPRLLVYLNAMAPACVYLPGLLENLSHAQQRGAGTVRFSEPVLLGRNVGATVVYIAQIQAPALAFGAAVALDPEPQITLTPPLCDHSPTARGAHVQTVKPEAPGENVPLRLLLDGQATAAQRAFVAAARVAGGGQSSLQPMDAASANSAGRDMAPRSSEAGSPESLGSAYAAALARLDANPQVSSVGDLPLVEVPAATAAGTAFAIMYSGDGGWRDLDRTLADVLASKGLSVVGVDVLRYYWNSKSPRLAARDLARIIRYYQVLWQRRKVLLIGFSFGANVLPFLVNRLPADLRSDLSLVSLLSPERVTAFAVDPGGWLGFRTSSTVPVEPELRGLAKIPLQCVYGEDEASDSLCTTAAAAVHDIVRKSGGHHFDENYGELADQILAAAR